MRVVHGEVVLSSSVEASMDFGKVLMQDENMADKVMLVDWLSRIHSFTRSKFGAHDRMLQYHYSSQLLQLPKLICDGREFPVAFQACEKVCSR